MSAWATMLWTGPFLPLFALAWPLLLGAALVLPVLRRHPLIVLPLAPLPGLALALAGTLGATTEAPALLLGVELRLEPALRPFLLMSALLWLMAGVYAQGMADARGQDDRQAIFAGFWCLTLSGNLGVFLTQDAASFYVAFAAVSLAAWFIVVHARSNEALAAGRLYIILAVAGEIALLAGLLIGVQAAGGSTAIADIRAALPHSGAGGLAALLMALGFAVKAGIVPLHVWLPLAHPVAPVVGSAVLSGAIVKAGLVGLMLFLPPGWGATALVALGLAGAFGAALWGLTQANPKAVLAYSTVSQMGLMAALLGAGSASVASYALHHGLAKGALFLGAGLVMASTTGRGRASALALCALAAASVAGLPLTGGAAIKAAVKADIAPAVAMAVTLSGATTALLLGWFLYRLLRGETGKSHPVALQLAPLSLLATAALALPWALWPEAAPVARTYALRPDALAEAVWPVALGLATGALALSLRRLPAHRPPGDLLAVIPSALAASRRLWQAVPAWSRLRLPSRLLRPALRTTPAALAARAEAVMQRWPLSGVAMAASVIALTALALL